MNFHAKSIVDQEFGKISIRYFKSSSRISLTVSAKGKLRASLPYMASTRTLKKLIEDSRPKIRKLLDSAIPSIIYKDGDRVGKNHYILFKSGNSISSRNSKNKIIITLPNDISHENEKVQTMIREQVVKALRKEARDYLTKRLEILANQLDFEYSSVGFSHATSRWGSCSSRKKITLNIALMKMPFEVIDYVLIHELCHTKEMNHSQDFWNLVKNGDPSYIVHKNYLKNQTPVI